MKQRFIFQIILSLALALTGMPRWCVLAQQVESTFHPEGGSGSAWQSVGPVTVTSPNYGATSGRVTALALDPSDTSGNTLYVGVTGGGVWKTTNAQASAASVVFTPLTDSATWTTTTNCGASQPVYVNSLSIGALTVQPGGSGIILAGTGDPNNAYDSYYGNGILRSTNNGASWSLIEITCDYNAGNALQNFFFQGTAVGGFAWSTKSGQTNTVVAAVNQSYEGTLVGAPETGETLMGLYYSPDAGATWYLSTIQDSTGTVQGPAQINAPYGVPATSVVWNPKRNLFIAAIQYHGYYSSPDGVTWTRLANQPGSGLSTVNCPTNTTTAGSINCPIFRGSLAVNPSTGDTFAWTVNLNLQDQGIWQDQCQLSGSVCLNTNITFGVNLNSSVMDTSTTQGAKTVVDGDYTLTLAAVPNQQDTEIFAGDADLYECSLANSCVWRDTTNSQSCMSAAVSPFIHAFAWNPTTSTQVFVGNDGGLWRSTDLVGETGAVCNSADSTHFQNLNSTLGSIADVYGLSVASGTANTVLAGLWVNGAAGVKGTSTPPTTWAQVLGGLGGSVLIDRLNATNWLVNNQAGVNIKLCAQAGACTSSAFGSTPLVGEASVSYDGLLMTTPAAMTMDPCTDGTANAELLVATCRVWRGPATSTWTGSNNGAISPILDSSGNSFCNGDTYIRAMAASCLTDGVTDEIYVGTFGDNGLITSIPGHVFSAKYNTGTGATATWSDLSANPVTNATNGFNPYSMDVTAIYVDSVHDTTGNTVYVALSGVAQSRKPNAVLYMSTNGGASWQNISNNLPEYSVNAIAVDPQSAQTVYVATDDGVYYTSLISTCSTTGTNCWALYGTSLPAAPVTNLIADVSGSTTKLLTAGTYGRGVWQIALNTASVANTTATLSPTSLSFGNQIVNTSSSASNITLKNTGSTALLPTLIQTTGNFSETDNCQGQTITAGNTCTIHVVFTPTTTGALTGTMVVSANVSGGQLTASFTGTGVAAGALTLSPPSVTFPNTQTGTVSANQYVTISNTGGVAVTITGLSTSSAPPFYIQNFSCQTSLQPNTQCSVPIAFYPGSAGTFTSVLNVVSGLGTQTASLTGTGVSPATATLSSTRLNFPNTVVNTTSAPMTFTLTNNGGMTLTNISQSYNTTIFTVTNNCGTTLNAGASCTFTATFLPSSIGTNLAANLIVSTALGQQTVTLVGTSVAAPVLGFNGHTYWSFGSQTEYVSQSVVTLSVFNTGSVGVSGLSLSITGSGATSFALATPSSNPCGTTLAANTGCNFGIVFTPQAVGSITANLQVTSTSPVNQTAALQLNGTGIAPPLITANPYTVVFGSVVLGTTSPAESLIVKNSGGTSLNDLTLTITSGGPQYAISSTNCGGSLGPTATCTVYLSYTPTTTAATTGVLTLASASNACAPVTISLQGSAVPASIITANPVELDYGNQVVSQTSSSQTLTISANGNTALSGLSFSTPTGSGFTATAGTCGSSLKAYASCTETVTFTPPTTGYQTANLTVSSTTPYVTPAVILLTGTGISAGVIQPSPSQANFGSVIVNQTSAALNLTVTNGGGSDLTGLSFANTGNFAIAQNSCPATLSATLSCSISLTFTPTQSGALTGTLSITTTSAGASKVSVPLSGNGLTSGSLTIAPTFISFGTVTNGQSSAVQTLTLKNTGGSSAKGLSYALTGSFSNNSSSTTCGTTLAAGASCAYAIVFSPQSVGSLVGQLKVSSTTSGVSTVYAGLFGNGSSGAALVVSPSALAFASTPEYTTSSPQSFTVSNPGTATTSGLSIVTSSNFTDTTTCGSTLSAGSSCTVSVRFAPQLQGALTGQSVVTSTTAGVTGEVVTLSGTATTPAYISLSPNPLNFPGTGIGLTSAPLTLTVSNLGSAYLNTPTVSIAGPFSIQSNSCTQNIAAGGSCNVNITFTPTAAGGNTGTLTVSSTTNGVPTETATLSGVGIGPAQISASPSSISFPALSPGQTGSAQTVTLLVSGGVGVTNVNTSVDAGFVVTQNNCAGQTLQDGGTCTILVAFAPTAVANYSGQLTITASGTQGPAAVALSGVAFGPPNITATPGNINFPTTGVGITSAPITVTLTNASAYAAVNNVQLALVGGGLSASTDYQITSNSCGATLAASGTCNVVMTYTPSAVGPAQLAWLTVNGSNLAQPLNLPIFGIGLTFNFAATGTTSYTIASGQTANYVFNLTIPSTNPPTGSLQAVVTLSCGTLPLNASCEFIPANCVSNCQSTSTVTVSEGSIAQAALVISTTKSATASKAAGKTAAKSTSGVPAMTLALCALLLLPLRKRRAVKYLLCVMLLAASVVGLSSCTEARLLGTIGTGGGGGSSTTPPGTYTITVSATADGLTQQSSVMLTVD